MKKLCVSIALFITASVAGVFGPPGPTRTVFADSPGHTDDLTAVALAFADACSSGESAQLRQLAGPAFEEVTATGQTWTLDDLIKSCRSGVRVTLSNCQLSGPNVVSCDTVLSGGAVPPLAHPWTETSMLTFSDGKVIRLDETLSEQTARDLEAFLAANSQPGMPTTGLADSSIPLLALLGLLIVLTGALARRPVRGRTNS